MSKHSGRAGHPDNQLADAAAEMTRFAKRRVRAALLEVAGALAKRPSERWDDIARADADVRESWTGRDVEWCREALTAAAVEGPDVLAETRRRVERLFAEKCEASLHGFTELSDSMQLPEAALEYTADAARAIVAVQTAREHHDESSFVTARRELVDTFGAAARILELISPPPTVGRTALRAMR